MRTNRSPRLASKGKRQDLSALHVAEAIVGADALMVVLKPLFEGERIRVCRECGLVGLGSPERARSSFYRAGRGWRGECIWCSRRLREERRQTQRREDPEGHREQRRLHQRRWVEKEGNRERRRKVQREYAKRKQREDPEWRARKNEIQRRYKAKVRQTDPERAEQWRMDARMNHRLRREREGHPLKTPDPAPTTAGKGRSVPRLPVGPFARWLDRLVEDEAAKLGDFWEGDGVEGPESRVANLLGMSKRRLCVYRTRDEPVVLTTVEDAITRHGSAIFEDVYPWEVIFAGLGR